MRISCILFLLMLGSSAFAQNLTRSVVAAQGAYKKAPDGPSLSWTLGELSAAYAENGPSIQQGFQQAELGMTVGISRPLIPPSSWQAFPNPTDFYLQLETDFKDSWQYELQDLLGRRLLQGIATQATQRLDLPVLKDGMYLIVVRDQEGRSASKKLFIHQN